MNKDVKRIREIDEQIRALFSEKDKILNKYTWEEINKLHNKFGQMENHITVFKREQSLFLFFGGSPALVRAGFLSIGKIHKFLRANLGKITY